jgi:hypothetical protein
MTTNMTADQYTRFGPTQENLVAALTWVNDEIAAVRRAANDEATMDAMNDEEFNIWRDDQERREDALTSFRAAINSALTQLNILREIEFPVEL